MWSFHGNARIAQGNSFEPVAPTCAVYLQVPLKPVKKGSRKERAEGKQLPGKVTNVENHPNDKVYMAWYGI